MSVMLIIFLSMAAYVLVLALLTWYGNSTEKQLGYPKQNGTLEDLRCFFFFFGRAFAQKCNYHSGLCGIDAELCQPFARCFFGVQRQWRRTNFGILHHGGCGCRSSDWSCDYRNDVPKHEICGCKYF